MNTSASRNRFDSKEEPTPVESRPLDLNNSEQVSIQSFPDAKTRLGDQLEVEHCFLFRFRHHQHISSMSVTHSIRTHSNKLIFKHQTLDTQTFAINITFESPITIYRSILRIKIETSLFQTLSTDIKTHNEPSSSV